MHALHSLKLLALFFGIALVSCAENPVKPDADRNRAAARKVVGLVNQARVERGLNSVRPDEGLSQLAQNHADRLTVRVDPRRGKPSRAAAHQNFDRRSSHASKSGYVGLFEVVMVGFAGDLSQVAQRTLRGWLSSDSHRRVILHPGVRLIGVDAQILDDGRYYVVGQFSRARTERGVSNPGS